VAQFTSMKLCFVKAAGLYPMRNSQIAFAHSLHISSVGISVMLFLDCSRNLVTNSFESINRPPQAGFPDGEV